MVVYLLLRPILPYLLLALGLVLVGEALGFPVASAVLSALWDGLVWVGNWLLDWLASAVYDRVNPLSIAFKTPLAAG